jgi:hypothetical protein
MSLKNNLYGSNLICSRCSLLDYRPPSCDHWRITDRYMLNHTRIIKSGTYIFSGKL